MAVTKEFLGKNKLVKRLAAQVGSEQFAKNLLKKRKHMKEDGELTVEGMRRNEMTAAERAKARAAKVGGRKPSEFTYDKNTNRATLTNRKPKNGR